MLHVMSDCLSVRWRLDSITGVSQILMGPKIDEHFDTASYESNQNREEEKGNQRLIEELLENEAKEKSERVQNSFINFYNPFMETSISLFPLLWLSTELTNCLPGPKLTNMCNGNTFCQSLPILYLYSQSHPRNFITCYNKIPVTAQVN